jgi:predicted nucleic acid-binding protein
MRPAPDPWVMKWLAAQQPLDVALSALTLGEIELGLVRLAPGRRRTMLERWLSEELPRQFQDRILGVDIAVAREWGRLTARATVSGRSLPVVDALLLATASVHGLTFVTRNESDCAARGVPVFNPWREG